MPQKKSDKDYQSLLEKKFKKIQEELKEAQENKASLEDLKKITKTLKKQGELLLEFEEKIKEVQVKSMRTQLKSFLEEKKEELEKIKQQKKGIIEFVFKDPEPITTGSGANAETPPVNRSTELGDFNLRNDNDLLNLCTVTETDEDSHRYTEMIPKDGDFTFVAEGGEKPQIDFRWENRFARPVKAAAYEVLTEEALTDVSRMMSTAEQYLRKKHDLFKVNGVYFGDGTGENPTGATVYGRAFVAGDMANAVVNPNFMDVVNAAATDVYTTQNFTDEEPYVANIAMINPIDFYLRLVSAKDDRGLPLYPQAGLFSRVDIGGMTIIPWSKIPSDEILVADMSQYNVSNYIPFSLRIGYINDQFIHNQLTMVGESRFYAYVRNLDQNAFIYDDISVIQAAIAQP